MLAEAPVEIRALAWGAEMRPLFHRFFNRQRVTLLAVFLCPFHGVEVSAWAAEAATAVLRIFQFTPSNGTVRKERPIVKAVAFRDFTLLPRGIEG